MKVEYNEGEFLVAIHPYVHMTTSSMDPSKEKGFPCALIRVYNRLYHLTYAREKRVHIFVRLCA